MKKIDKMKKMVLGLGVLSLLALESKAQLATGGLPASLREIKNDNMIIPTTHAQLPDWEGELKKWDENPSSFSKPYLISLFTPTDLSFSRSGIVYTTENGTRVWRSKLNIPGAKAIGLYYDSFHLPKGVKLFISNENGKQVLGAYTEANNNKETAMFANEPVQGSTVNIELDIEAGVNMEEIKLHINRSAVYFRGIEYLMEFAGNLETIDQFDSQLAGRSSVCNFNAVCPLGNNYIPQRDAALHTLCVMDIGVGTCSSTMINTANNSLQDCKQYLLIASHCEFSNSTSDHPFSQYIFRFNYQHNVCTPPTGTITNTQQSITGAKFVARSIVPLDVNGQPDATNIKGDFILLEFTGQNKIPDSWNVNLAGWNNSPTIPLSYAQPQKFIGFHHPSGDVKKVSSGQAIESQAIGAPNSHWLLPLDSGYAAQGSSGSALFDGDGRIIGVASVAAPMVDVPLACIQTQKNTVDSSTAKYIFYSKLSYDWDYSVDGTALSSKLKPWLDPNNSNVTTVNMSKSNCTPLTGGPTGITINNAKLDQAINIFPNPSHNGRINIQINLPDQSDLQMELYDISGKKLNTYKIGNIRSGTYNLDLSTYTNGVYLLKLTDGYNITSRKVMLSK